MSQRPIREVEDYTRPFLVSACVLLFMGLLTLWATLGYFAALISGLFINMLIGRIPDRN